MSHDHLTLAPLSWLNPPNQKLLAVFPSEERQLVRIYATYSEISNPLMNAWFQLKGNAFAVVFFVYGQTVLKQQEWAMLAPEDFLHGFIIKGPKTLAKAITEAQTRRAIKVEECQDQPGKKSYALDYTILDEWLRTHPEADA